MSVFRDAVIVWGGVEYTVTPSNRLLRAIEKEVCILRMVAECQSGMPKLSDVAYVLSALLRSAGADVSEDEAYQSLAHGDTNALIAAIVLAIIPDVPEKKAEAPAAKEG